MSCQVEFCMAASVSHSHGAPQLVQRRRWTLKITTDVAPVDLTVHLRFNGEERARETRGQRERETAGERDGPSHSHNVTEAKRCGEVLWARRKVMDAAGVGPRGGFVIRKHCSGRLSCSGSHQVHILWEEKIWATIKRRKRPQCFWARLSEIPCDWKMCQSIFPSVLHRLWKYCCFNGKENGTSGCLIIHCDKNPSKNTLQKNVMLNWWMKHPSQSDFSLY